MQLQSLAKSTNALNKITNILNNTELTRTTVLKELESVGRSYTTETLKSALAQSTLNEKQIEAILYENGLRGEILKNTTAEVANTASINDVKNSFNELASSIIDGVSVTKGFNDQTKNLCAQLLKEMGIINADQIVLEKLNQTKIQQKAASIDFSDATADEIRNLTAYGEELGFTSQQVYELYLQQLLVNDDPLQTKSSIPDHARPGTHQRKGLLRPVRRSLK